MMGLPEQVGAYDESDLKKLKETKECNKCDLKEADLTKAILFKANLTEANLTKAKLKEAKLGNANLTKAILFRAKLSKAELNGATLEDADLSKANLKDANLNRANLTGSNLTETKLRRAQLKYANLTGANLTGANLKDANLEGADLTGANLEGADLTGANLIDISIDETALATNSSIKGTIQLAEEKGKKEEEAYEKRKEQEKQQPFLNKLGKAMAFYMIVIKCDELDLFYGDEREKAKVGMKTINDYLIKTNRISEEQSNETWEKVASYDEVKTMLMVLEANPDREHCEGIADLVKLNVMEYCALAKEESVKLETCVEKEIKKDF